MLRGLGVLGHVEALRRVAVRGALAAHPLIDAVQPARGARAILHLGIGNVKLSNGNV